MADFLISPHGDLILVAVSTSLVDCFPHSRAAVAGCWSAGERLLRHGPQLMAVHVWFHFLEEGEAILSLRYLDREPSRVHGRWRLDREQLVATFGHSEIRAAFRVEDELMQWAGETLLRLPDRTASLPFGIQLPYRLSVADQPMAQA